MQTWLVSDESDAEVCQRCGRAAEQGFVWWNDGYALRWQPGEGERRWWNRREVLVGPRRPWASVKKVAAIRCPACRLVWFEY